MSFDTGVRFIYILGCRDGTFYVGMTKDLFQRLHDHERGVGCRYTKGRRPVSLLWVMQTNKHDAPKLERKLKRMSKAQKLQIVQSQMQRI